MISVKVSVGLTLLRLIVSKVQRWILKVVMALSVLTGMIFFFVAIFQCSPVSYFWDRSQDGSCINTEVLIALTYTYSTINGICDFTFGLLPIALIYDLQMTLKTKLMVVPILSMACMYGPLLKSCFYL